MIFPIFTLLRKFPTSRCLESIYHYINEYCIPSGCFTVLIIAWAEFYSKQVLSPVLEGQKLDNSMV